MRVCGKDVVLSAVALYALRLFRLGFPRLKVDDGGCFMPVTCASIAACILPLFLSFIIVYSFI